MQHYFYFLIHFGKVNCNCVVQGFSARRRTVDGRKEKEKDDKKKKEAAQKKVVYMCKLSILSGLNGFKKKTTLTGFFKAFV